MMSVYYVPSTWLRDFTCWPWTEVALKGHPCLSRTSVKFVGHSIIDTGLQAERGDFGVIFHSE